MNALFDLHCDTLTALARGGGTWNAPPEGIMLRAADAEVFSPYHQVFAAFTDPELDDDAGFEEICAVLRCSPGLLADAAVTPHLAVEDGRLLGGDITRLDTLASLGVEILTLVWKGECCVGGAWDTDAGLTAFGREVVARCLSLGIIPDLSHASEATFWEAAEIITAAPQRVPLLASHSDSRAVCHHRRNLTDAQFAAVRDSGGIVGISLCPEHLRDASGISPDDGKGASLDNAAEHILHYLSLGGERTVALGCDYDGIDSTPDGLAHPGDLPALAGRLASLGCRSEVIYDIFFANAARVILG